jgi:hypothetical protein
MELDELLRDECVDDPEDLLQWAHRRADELLEGMRHDPELSPLLVAGGDGHVVAPRDPAPVARPTVPVHKEAQEEFEEIDDVELLDEDDVELMEEEPDTGMLSTGPAPHPELDAAPTEPFDWRDPPPEAAAPVQSYGPPDLGDDVPEWKAALVTAQVGEDDAAEKVREDSRIGRMPHAPVERLVAEEDHISQHSVDLSDLDGDPHTV